MLTPAEVEAYFEQVGIKAEATRGDWRDAKCPWHEDRSRSFTFNVASGGWKCHAGCGSGGLKEIAERSQVPFPKAPRAAKAKEEQTLQCAYDYRDEKRELVFQVLRYKKGASKTFRQRRPDGAGGWVWKMEGVRIIPYRLPELLAAAIDAPIFVVEGEKDADNLAALGFTATSNHGGAGKWREDHARHLDGRRVVILPDNDPPGAKHAEQVALSLRSIAAEIRVLQLPGIPPKGDASDWLSAGGTKEALLALAADSPLWTPPAASQEAAGASTPEDVPFFCLGYADGMYYYLGRQTQEVKALSPNGHTKMELCSLVQSGYWSKMYGKEGPTNWTKAGSDMMQACSLQGVFDYSRIRGRGAWYDRGRAVVHLGDSVIIGGQRHSLGQPEPRGFIYPAAIPIPIDYEHPIGNQDSARLSALCDMLSWEKPLNGRLLAGWLALAPICGALSWRPHIWITGAAGTGKSWVMDNIMRPCLGKVGLFVQGDTTEAGIRQALGYDARPVLFDEAEGETERSQVRMQNVMALMRQSSSENGSVIVKGSMSGAVKVYNVRSAFAFFSIGVGIKQHSDSTRVSVLSLKKSDDDLAAERFAEIREATADLLSPTWVAGLHARMISLIPTVRKNAEIFARAAAAHIGSQRMGDQAGALLAGAYALHNDQEVTLEIARAYVEKQDWSEQSTIQETPDEVLCLQRILQHVSRVPDGGGHLNEMSVAEMIESADYGIDPQNTPTRQTLLRMGIRVDEDSITIANQNSELQRILAGTNWGDWGRILRRIDGSRATHRGVRFAGVKVRGTIIPKAAISN